MGFRMLRTAAALVAVVLLAGCVPGDPVITPEPEPDATPVFASDEEALAAATEAYANYVVVSDEIFQNGGVQTDMLTEVMTGDFLASSIAGFQQAAEKGLHSTGQTTFDQVQLQQYDRTSSGPQIVVAYVCEDLSAVDVLDADGASVVSDNRPDRARFEVTFDLAPDGNSLLISQRIVWSTGEC